jgi:tetratricopeptide (TPR) repeat protein
MARLNNQIIVLGLGLAVTAGCAASECLRIPASAKVPETGVARCEKALRADLDRQDLLDRYVALLRLRGEHERIERIARAVLKHDTARTDARYFLAYALRQQGRAEEALAAYQAYAKVNERDPDPHYGMALCHEARGDVSAAISAYGAYLAREKRAAREDWRARARDRVAALRGAGVPRRRASAPDKPARRAAGAGGAGAVPRKAPAAKPPRPADCRAAEREISRDPFATQAYERFARCALALGRNADVVRRMRIALRDNPDFARGWLHLGRAQQALGDTAGARASLAKACAGGVTEACR